MEVTRRQLDRTGNLLPVRFIREGTRNMMTPTHRQELTASYIEDVANVIQALRRARKENDRQEIAALRAQINWMQNDMRRYGIDTEAVQRAATQRVRSTVLDNPTQA